MKLRLLRKKIVGIFVNCESFNGNRVAIEGSKIYHLNEIVVIPVSIHHPFFVKCQLKSVQSQLEGLISPPEGTF
jgi:hypothetical protein